MVNKVKSTRQMPTIIGFVRETTMVVNTFLVDKTKAIAITIDFAVVLSDAR